MKSAITAVVLAAPGTNRDVDVAHALTLAGAQVRIVSLAEVNAASLADARMAVVAGGFSFADALGSGRLFALELTQRLGDSLAGFVGAGRPVLGICNGFQTLVRAGILPGTNPITDSSPGDRALGGVLPASDPISAATPGGTSRADIGPATPEGTSRADIGPVALGHNAHGRFECRWVTLEAETASTCIWTAGIVEPIICPIAHGEGRFHGHPDTIAALARNGQIALRYRRADGSDAHGDFPFNPNGSDDDIAGICDPTGVVLGLMPHPEDHVLARQHPRWTRGERAGSCQPLFANGVRHAKEL